jgi:hypothetical protein
MPPNPATTNVQLRPVGVAAIVGINTAMGKSALAAGMAAFFESASVPVRMLRIETGERRREFPAGDLYIDTNRTGEAAHLVGGAAGLLDEVWPSMSETIMKGGVVVIDCGAGAQAFLLQAAAAAGLDDLMAAHGARCSLIVVTTPDPECGRQAARLVADARAQMPNAQIVMAVNHISAAQQSGADAPSQRAFAKAVAGLKDTVHLNVPFARGQALDCFGDATIIQILRARDEQLVQWSGKGVLASRAAQTHLAAWYRVLIDQLAAVYTL